MGRLIISLALITNLLVCPFRCMSSEWSAAGEGGTIRPACCCCQPPDECDDSRSRDEKREDDCSCPNCICEGAPPRGGLEISTVDVEVADTEVPVGDRRGGKLGQRHGDIADFDLFEFLAVVAARDETACPNDPHTDHHEQ